MKLAYTHPHCWPFVRRGNERNMDVMARYFTERGHDVVTISTRPGARSVESGDVGRRILSSPITWPGMSALRIDPVHTFYFRVTKELSALDVDIVHSLLFTDALAAQTVKRRKPKLKTVFQMNGVAIPGQSCRRFPPEAWMYRKVIAGADALITCSEYVAELVKTHFHADTIVIPPMVDVDAFGAAVDEGAEHPEDRDIAGRPIVFAAGDFTVPRKGVRVLLKAFPLVKEAAPDALLILSGRFPSQLIRETIAALPERWREDVRDLGLGSPDDLPGLYAQASVLVLPAMGEPSGTVLMEAWSAGTPIVATNHGGIPEFVRPEVGTLFDPETEDSETHNAEGLCNAILEGLELAKQPGTNAACREHAGRFAGDAIGEQLTALYRSLQ